MFCEADWVERTENYSIVRFKEADAATKFIEKLKECDSVIEIEGTKYTPELITGQEETDYWSMNLYNLEKYNETMNNKKKKNFHKRRR